ncbi:MAG: helix-turn-helix domain-containing protein [Treponema sp.]|nr:helix-turn-helix domain-containing protein [Treponema sp.]
MIHAYNKNLLSDAQTNLGFAFDYAVNCVGLKIDDFNDFFITSRVAAAFGDGSPKFVCGLSGTELALEIFDRLNLIYSITPYEQFDRTKEYWTGWILAYYQWFKGISFENIRDIVPASIICEMYNPLHEAAEEKFVEVMDNIIKSKNRVTNLQRLRKQAGLTQKRLAELSGVNLRTLQEYEIGAKDINKASGETINTLAKVLCCNFYDVMEMY